MGMSREQADSMERLYRCFLGVRMANLRMKCLVSSVRAVVDENGARSQEEIVLHAVYSDSGVNKQWNKWTPSCNISFSVSNPDAFNKVLPGQFYYVDLSQTTKDDPIA